MHLNMVKTETLPEINLDALKAHDPQEIIRFVESYSPFIYRLALKIIGDTQDAEDILQETFIKALRNLPSFEGRSSLATWLHRITVNEALMQIRRQKNNLVSLDEEPAGDEGSTEPLQIVDWNHLPEEDLLSVEARQHLDQAIGKLSPLLRVVFVLRDIEGLTVRETAEALNLTETAVKTRLLRARLRLRDDLTVYFGKRHGR
jgi:RNA polymerase sigma-70 factor, ECF subfamily